MSAVPALEHLNVVICVPSTGTWVSGFGHALAIMVADFMTWRPEGCRSKFVQILTQDSSMLVQSRYDLVKSALRYDATHVLFLDSDMIFPKDLLQQMLLRDKDVLGLNCTTRGWPVTHIAHGFDQQLIDSRGKRGLERVQQVGLAVMLIKAHVLKKLRPPFFMMEWVPDTGGYCGEDIYFCQVLQADNFDVWVDHDLSQDILHVGRMAYGQDLMRIGPEVAAILEARGKARDAKQAFELKRLKTGKERAA
jgi:hypothetical protein